MSVLEIAKMRCLPDQEQALELGLTAGAEVIASSPGCLGVEVRRSVEEPNTFVLLVQWESVELHQKYLKSPDSPMFRAHIEGARDVSSVEAAHYTLVVDTAHRDR